MPRPAAKPHFIFCRSVGSLALAALLFLGPRAADAQSTSDAISNALKQQLQNQATETTPQPYADQVRTLRPNLPEAYRLPPSPLEKSYSKRAGAELRQFGYESFGRPSEVTSRQTGALQDNYILGPGDQIIIELRGQENQSQRVYVNRDGTVVVPRMSPIPAAGRRLGDFRADVEQRVGETFVATQAFVTVGSVRQISVFVAGEVNAPGSISVNALNSPIDALLLAGGIKKSGSLRAIMIQRGDKKIPIDLYGVLTDLNLPLDAGLADGDKIIVPPIGPTTALVGEVARPGIYELNPKNAAIGARELVRLAGGYLVGGAKRLSVLRVHTDGSEAFEPGGSEAVTQVRASEILYVLATSDVARGRVALEGQVRIPGTYDMTRTRTLRGILTSADTLEEDPFVLFAVISRKDPSTFTRKLIPFAPIQIIRGDLDIPLMDDDVVRIFSTREIRGLVEQISNEQSTRELSSLDLRALRSLRGPGEQNVQGQLNAQQGQADNGQNANAALSQGTVGAALAGQQTSRLGQVGIQQQSQQPGYSGQNQQGYYPNSGTQNGATYGQPSQGPYQAPGASPGQMPGPQGQPYYPGYQAYPGYPGYTQPGQPYGAGPQSGPYSPELGAPPYGERFGERPKQLNSRTLIVDLHDPAVRNQLANYRTNILGAVQVPGEYLVAPNVGLDAVVGALGGLTTIADLTGVEITSTNYDAVGGVAKTSRTSFNLGRDELGRVKVQPGDVVRFRELYSDRGAGQVIVRGQVRFPGRFDILRGERLSSLIARAGGLTDVAYSYGAVFTRRSAARAEEDGYRRAADEIERQFTVLVSDENVTPQGVQFIRDTIERLQRTEGVGRISVEADPVKLIARPERDTIIEPDDFLFIPSRPNSVSVTGEVLSAGSYLFASGKAGRYYINLAGGYGPAADNGRTFVLMPDGTARPLTGSILSFGTAPIVPGATVIVPRNLRPFRFRQFAIDISQIFSQLAVSAASIAVISKQ
jgi:protein involved in polysaccharide export with SLBB domain